MFYEIENSFTFINLVLFIQVGMILRTLFQSEEMGRIDYFKKWHGGRVYQLIQLRVHWIDGRYDKREPRDSKSW